MSNDSRASDEETLRFGLLMESAQAHQKSAEAQLEKLRTHTQDLDEVVREEIRHTLQAELQMLTAETHRAAQSLRRISRGGGVRSALCSIGVSVLCAGLPLAIARWALPSAAEIATLRSRRDELAASVQQLQQRGGRIDWRRCGTAGRLCVRVDRRAPNYGEKGDYSVVDGY